MEEVKDSCKLEDPAGEQDFVCGYWAFSIVAVKRSWSYPLLLCVRVLG